MTLDPCDRAFYVGFDDSSVQLIDLFQLSATTNALYDPELQSTPIQVQANPFGGSPPDLGLVHCLGLSYDGTTLLSGHASGKIIQWQTGPRNFSKEIADLNAPVTNLAMLSPFPSKYPTKAITVSKPRLGEGNHTFVAQFTESLKTNDTPITDFGFPPGVLEEAILDFSRPSAVVSTTDAQLKKENEELLAIVNEQNALQKQTWSKYRKVQSGKVEG
jgi:pre-rRNA-processing protein IPI3